MRVQVNTCMCVWWGQKAVMQRRRKRAKQTIGNRWVSRVSLLPRCSRDIHKSKTSTYANDTCFVGLVKTDTSTRAEASKRRKEREAKLTRMAQHARSSLVMIQLKTKNVEIKRTRERERRKKKPSKERCLIGSYCKYEILHRHSVGHHISSSQMRKQSETSCPKRSSIRRAHNEQSIERAQKRFDQICSHILDAERERSMGDLSNCAFDRRARTGMMISLGCCFYRSAASRCVTHRKKRNRRRKKMAEGKLRAHEARKKERKEKKRIDRRRCCNFLVISESYYMLG